MGRASTEPSTCSSHLTLQCVIVCMFFVACFPQSSSNSSPFPDENLEDHEGDSPEATKLGSKQFQAQNSDLLTASLLLQYQNAPHLPTMPALSQRMLHPCNLSNFHILLRILTVQAFHLYLLNIFIKKEIGIQSASSDRSITKR